MLTSSSRAQLASPLVVVLQLLLGGALGIALTDWLTTAAKQLPYHNSTLLPLLLVGIVFWLTVLVHEGGHWVGGHLTGMRCFAVGVLWMHLERREARWRLHLRKRRPGTMGYVISLPLGFEQLRQRIALFIAAGPIASLAAGSLALAAGWVLRQPYRAGVPPGHVAGYVIAELLFLFGVGSLLTGVLNALPFTTRHGNASDGERLRRLRRPGPQAELELGRFQLASYVHQGVRPRDWPATLVTQLLAGPQQPAQLCHSHLCAYAHALDRADMEAARLHWQAAYDTHQGASPAVGRSLYCEAVYLAVLHDNQPELAAQWQQGAEQLLPFKGHEACFTQALVACSEGDWATARQQLVVCERETLKVTCAGLREQGLDRIREVHAFIKQHELAPLASA